MVTDSEMLELMEKIARYANTYETLWGAMTLKDVIEDGINTIEDYELHEDAVAIRDTIKWT